MTVIEFYHPGKKFPSLSVTGDHCERLCRHCRGHFLKNMVDVSTPGRLRETAEDLESGSASGFLLSGGFNDKGMVPLDGYYEVLKDIKRKTDLSVNVHTGVPDEEMTDQLKETGIDMVSYDVIGSEKTIKEVYGLELKPSDIQIGYELLTSRDMDVVPHITIGLHGGDIKGEYHALDMVWDSEKLVLNTLVPSFWGESVGKEDILKVIETAVERTDADLILGCMRERGRPDTEIEAVKKGIKGIVLPSRKTREWVKERYDILEKNVCCCF